MKTNKLTKHCLLILAFTLTLTMTLNAQITIGSGSTPHKDALLELKEKDDNSSTKGLLLPRVPLTSTALSAPLSEHVAGMTVYNTASTGDVTPGYYYNNGSKWVKLFAEVSSVTPTFFYMPSIVLPTDTSDPSYNSSAQTFVIDLYQVYNQQFALANSVTSSKSPGANALPVLANNALEYYVTYYDNTVFQNVSLSDNGVLTYKLFPELNVSDKTFMNIVFKVK